MPYWKFKNAHFFVWGWNGSFGTVLVPLFNTKSEWLKIFINYFINFVLFTQETVMGPSELFWSLGLP